MSSRYPQPTPEQLRLGLHGLVLTLAVVVLVRAVALDEQHAVAISGLVVAFSVLYVVRVLRDRQRPLLLLAIIGTWTGMVLLGADAAYASVGLFLVFLTELSLGVALFCVLAVTAIDVGIALGQGGGPTTLVAPVLGAVLASLFGLGYRMLFDAIAELQRTRSELAESERAAGQAGERQRLAREIHDTVAQGLSSIQMLLHTVEDEPLPQQVRERIVLARTTAAAGLTEARRMVAELAPADLVDSSLASALRGICDRSLVEVRFQLDSVPAPVPMPIEAALVRIAQGALANVEQHAGPDARAVLTLGWTPERVHLDVVDDGVGFDTDALAGAATRSFGLTSIRSRVAELGGTFDLESTAGHTAVAVSFPRT